MDFDSLLRTPYLIRPVASPPPEGGAHRFCGPHDIAGADCPNCHKKLLRFVSLDLRDPRLGALRSWPASRIELLFCWTCNVAQKPFQYRVHADAPLELVTYGAGMHPHHPNRRRPPRPFPYADYPVAFAAGFGRLDPVDPLTQRAICQANRGIEAAEDPPRSYFEITGESGLRHHLGGEPVLVERDIAYPRGAAYLCPSCGSRMPFLASIGSDTLDARPFVRNPYVQILYHACMQCAVIGAAQMCD